MTASGASSRVSAETSHDRADDAPITAYPRHAAVERRQPSGALYQVRLGALCLASGSLWPDAQSRAAEGRPLGWGCARSPPGTQPTNARRAMIPVTASVTTTEAVTATRFSESEHTHTSDAQSACAFFYTLTPDLMSMDLWTHADAPAIPVLVAASACWNSRALRAVPWPRTTTMRFCDSGGFVFGRAHGGFPFSLDDYTAWLAAMRPDVAACLDLPCEPAIAGDDAEVARRQAWTLAAAAELLRRPAPWQWLPVIQGREMRHYIEHARAYKLAGLVQPYMGIGSLCRRSSIRQIRAIVSTLADELPGVRFHLFGVALRLLTGTVGLPPAVYSLDSAAWNGRFGSDLPAFNAEMHARGWSQRETAIRWALPRYAQKVTAALAGCKQRVLF